MTLYRDVVDRLVKKTCVVFGVKLTGIYLHGSMAMGCFNPHKSDIDIIVVINGDISDFQKLEFMREIVELNGSAPAKGIEISVVKGGYCKPFVYPTPHELHFSPAHLERYKHSPETYIREMKGTDKDLAAHFTVINNYGKVLYGEKISEVFGEVPKTDYIDSIYFDVQNALSDIANDPIYVTLNLCRVLAFLRSGRCLSKLDGDRWGIDNLDFGLDVISKATECYQSQEEMTADINTENFAKQVLALICAEIEKLA